MFTLSTVIIANLIDFLAHFDSELDDAGQMMRDKMMRDDAGQMMRDDAGQDDAGRNNPKWLSMANAELAWKLGTGSLLSLRR